MADLTTEYSGVVVIDLCINAALDNPVHITIELLCIAVIGYLLTRKPEKQENPLTEQEVDTMIEEWKPEPLHKAPAKGEEWFRPTIIDGPISTHVKVNQKPVVNFSTSDFLSLNNDKRITDKALKCIDDYGCGSCGPRGFYGTIDVHVQLEERLSKFMGTNKSIIYSADIATAPSVIPTFSKVGDVIVYDEMAGFTLQEGIKMSKSSAVPFKHNDMKDLEQKLQQVMKEYDSGKRKANLHRRFIVTEAISYNTGMLCPLKRVVELKEKYGFRLILDESFSLGVLGKTGRGATEHFDVKVTDVDILTSSMATAMATMGGFCTGSDQCVDHQRLSGSGYVFSASSPPYLSVAGCASLDIIEAEPQRLSKLAKNAGMLHSKLKAAIDNYPYIKLLGHSLSPVNIVSLPYSAESDRHAQNMVEAMLAQGVMVSRLLSSPGEKRLVSGLRMTVTHDHTEEDMDKLVQALEMALKQILTKQ